jgi:ribose transport system permease protein
VGTLIGVAAVSVLRNGLNLIGLSSTWQLSTVGTVIILAIVVDALRGI